MMKYLVLFLVLVSSVSSFAAKGLEAKLANETCHFVVTKEIVFPYGKDTIYVGVVVLQSQNTDAKNNRRLKKDRIIKILDTGYDELIMDDQSVKSICVMNAKGGCADIRAVEADKFPGYSSNSLRLDCTDKPTIDF